jgi:hypothetical protein
MKVSEVLGRWPSTLETFKTWGFTALANPAARATFARLVSVEKACRIHKVSAGDFLAALDRHVAAGAIPLPVVEAEGPRAGSSGPRTPAMAAAAPPVRRGPARLDARVGEILRAFPVARPVLERRFGTETLTCPGLAIETLRQAAEIHGVEAEALVAEVNEAIRSSGGTTGPV